MITFYCFTVPARSAGCKLVLTILASRFLYIIGACDKYYVIYVLIKFHSMFRKIMKNLQPIFQIRRIRL